MKKIDELIEKLYHDTKKLRELIITDSIISKQILAYENSMDFWGYIRYLQDNDPEKYSSLKKKLISEENKRLKYNLKHTKDNFVKWIIKNKLADEERDIDLKDEEVQMDAFYEVKGLLPHSEKIIGYGHRRIFYSLGMVQFNDEPLWLGYKKNASSWGHGLENTKNSKVAKEVEGLCHNQLRCGKIMPRGYLTIYNNTRLLGIVTQDVTYGGNISPKWQDWETMTFEEGDTYREYIVDAKYYKNNDYETEFLQGARIMDLRIDINELPK